MSGVFRTIDHTPPLHPASVSSPALKGGGIHTRRAVRGGGNIVEDARHWIGLLQYNPSTSVLIDKCVWCRYSDVSWSTAHTTRSKGSVHQINMYRTVNVSPVNRLVNTVS
jgi:hypothetical protein